MQPGTQAMSLASIQGFNTTNEVFSINGTVPSRVKYIPTPPKLPPSVEPAVDLALIKAKEWEYEREWQFCKLLKTRIANRLSCPDLSWTILLKVYCSTN
jgi:hypothetical protein